MSGPYLYFNLFTLAYLFLLSAGSDTSRASSLEKVSAANLLNPFLGAPSCCSGSTTTESKTDVS